MTTQTEENTITRKTKELCEAIVAQPEIISIRKRIDLFLSDAGARSQYEMVAGKGQALHDKQHGGQPLDGAEVSDFEKHREVLLNNPVARDFLDAREELHEIQHSIQKYVSKTLELG